MSSFDRVNHQRLLARLAQRVCDRRLLVLIGRMLKAKVVLPDGVVIGVDEGVPQGSPLTAPTQSQTSSLSGRFGGRRGGVGREAWYSSG
ncbi:MAG: hypothetical protein ACRDM7_20955 [Thermoleophilaceae bacterium]